MPWTESRYWKTMAFLAIVGLFTLAWTLGTQREVPVVQPAPAENILVVPEATSARLGLLTTADNGMTLIWWYFRKDNPESIELIGTKTFRSR